MSVYRPRKRTKEEEEKEEDLDAFKKKKKSRSKWAGNAFLDATRPDFFQSSSNPTTRDFRDYVYVPTNAKSRAQLDELAYARQSHGTRREATGGGVPSLSQICVNVVAENWNEPGVLNGIREDHRLHVQSLLTEIARRNPSGVVPFKCWGGFSQASELPLSRRTYRELVLDDKLELEWLQKMNEQACIEWAVNNSSPRRRQTLTPEIETPCYILAMLDLSLDLAFNGDEDIWKLRGTVAPFLVYLKLPPSVTDAALSSIVRNVGEDSAPYERVEVLILNGAKGVTDKAAVQLAKLPSLRMLDLRNTSCTSEFYPILNRNLPVSVVGARVDKWRRALRRDDISPNSPELEFQLFGPSLTPSFLLTKLHFVANFHRDISIVSKPISLLIKSVSRSPSLLDSDDIKPKSEQFEAQLSSHANAAYHRAFGAITSSVPISKEVLDEDEDKADRHAFKNRGQGVSMPTQRGGPQLSTLFAIGQRKYTVEIALDDAISDWGSDGEREEDEREKRVAEENARRLPFYQAPAAKEDGVEKSKKMKVFKAAAPSDLMILRHLPVRLPHEPPVRPPPADIKPTLVRLEEGAKLKKKRPLDNDPLPFTNSFPRSSSVPTSSPLPPTPSFNSKLPSSSLPSSRPFGARPIGSSSSTPTSSIATSSARSSSLAPPPSRQPSSSTSGAESICEATPSPKGFKHDWSRGGRKTSSPGFRCGGETIGEAITANCFS